MNRNCFSSRKNSPLYSSLGYSGNKINPENYMKSQLEKEKFIELRANGICYDKISQELDISKPTLLKWGRECHKEISNRLYIDYEALISEYSLKKKLELSP